MSKQTICEKIFSAHSGREVHAGDIAIARIDRMLTHDSNRPLPHQKFLKLPKARFFDRDKIIYFIDHVPLTPNDVVAGVQQEIRKFCREYGLKYHEVGEGICHRIFYERGYVLPGDLVIGSDSHTCTNGALNALAIGVGSSDLVMAMVTGHLWFRIPATVRINLEGKLPEGVCAKDISLFLLGALKSDFARYKCIEYGGNLIRNLSLDGRITITNMGAEMGAKTAVMEPDGILMDWARPFRENLSPVLPDQDVVYDQSLTYDLSRLKPQVAVPHNVDNVVDAQEVAGQKIDIAVIGTCSGGKLEDLLQAGAILKGKKVAQGTRLYVIPASKLVLLQALRAGVIEELVEAGALLVTPGCAGCTGGTYCNVPGPGEVVLSTGPRNFKGRLGQKDASVYLASPVTVALSAISGKISVSQ